MRIETAHVMNIAHAFPFVFFLSFSAIIISAKKQMSNIFSAIVIFVVCVLLKERKEKKNQKKKIKKIY